MTDEPRDLESLHWVYAEAVEKPVCVMFERMFGRDWGEDFYEDAQRHLDQIGSEVDAVHGLMDALEPDDEARGKARRWREKHERRDADCLPPMEPGR